MHFEGRLCQQNSRIPVFVRKLFVYFVIRKEIEHKNVKRQVLEPLPANGSLKKSQPIARQVRFDCLQNLEIWSLFQGLAATHTAICEWWVEFFIAVRFVKNLRQKLQPSEWSIYAAPPPSFSMLNVVRRSVMRVKKSTKTDFNTKFRERIQHWKGGGGCVSWFKMFVITKDIEHKNVKRQVLEPLPANVPPKKSQPEEKQNPLSEISRHDDKRNMH